MERNRMPAQKEDKSATTAKRPFLSFIRMIFYTRFSVFAAGLMVVLGALPWFVPNPTITAVYLQSSDLRMLTLTWMSFLAAALMIMTFRATLFNAVDRFDDPSMERYASDCDGWVQVFRRWSLFLFGLPIPVSCFFVAWFENDAESNRAHWTQAVSLAIGMLAALVTLWAVNQLYRWFLTPRFHDARFFPNINPLFSAKQTTSPSTSKAGFSLSLGQWLARMLHRFGFVAGYLRTETYRAESDSEDQQVMILRVGHGPLAVFTTCLFVINLGVLVLGKQAIGNGVLPDDQGPFGTLFYLLGLVMLVAGILPGISFFLDRFRVPVAWFVASFFAALLGINYFFPSFIVDHAYDVAPLPHYEEANSDVAGDSSDFLESPLRIEDMIQGWKKRQQRIAAAHGTEPNKTFVIVTAAGGGIQAAGWTTTVYEGLGLDTPELLGGIGAISCVSGGSVGTLYLIARYQEIIEAIEADDLTKRKTILTDMVHQSTRSCLEAVGFGLLFPDTWRQFGLFVRDPTYDRGWVQQKVWASRMDSMELGIDGRSDWRLGHLAAGVKSGTLPAIVFNGFSTTTGQRIWFAPFAVRKQNELRRPEDFIEFSMAAGMQLPLSTAARLSATFPYVSPTAIARGVGSSDDVEAPFSRHLVGNSHFADGGYTDNEGLLTALEIVWQLDEYYDTHDDCPFDNILLLRIAPIPSREMLSEESYANSKSRYVEKGSAYIQGLLGPALGLYQGRIVTQIERGDLELDTTQNFFDLRTKANKKINQSNGGEIDSRQHVQIRRVRRTKQVQLQPLDDGEKERKPLGFSHQLVDFRLNRDGKEITPPLSWKLSAQQIADLDEAWKNWKRNANLGPRIAVATSAPSENDDEPDRPNERPPQVQSVEQNLQELQSKFQQRLD